jgi:hypothetical protein
MTDHVTESQFASAVEDMLTVFGWRWTHFRPARTAQGYRTPLSGMVGFPDYVCVRDGRVLFFELKSDKGKRTGDQDEWAAALKMCRAVEYWLWHPRNWQEVEDVLRR